MRFSLALAAVLVVSGVLAGLSSAAAPETAVRGAAVQARQAVHGIIVLDCASPVRVLQYPANGGRPVTLATFPSGNCDSNVTAYSVPTPLLAQQFTSDFQRMAITVESPYKNGNQHIGFVTTTGRWFDLTPAGKEKGDDSGFSGPPCGSCNVEWYPRFQPHTTWLYFVRNTPTGEILMKVNSSVGAGSRAAARFNRKPGSQYASYNQVPVGASFSGDGKVIVPLLVNAPGSDKGEVYLLNEHGTFALGSLDNNAAGADCQLARTLPQMYAPGAFDGCRQGVLVNAPCTVNSWAGTNAGLCSDGSRIWIVTGVNKPASAHRKPLTPDVGRQNRDPVGSPDGGQFAFVSKVPATDTSPATGDQLWVGSTAGGHLRKLGTIPTDSHIIGWR